MDFMKNERVVNWSVFPRLFGGFSLYTKGEKIKKTAPLYNVDDLWINFPTETREIASLSNRSFIENDHGHNETYHRNKTKRYIEVYHPRSVYRILKRVELWHTPLSPLRLLALIFF